MYSPFVVEMGAENATTPLAFSVISFKDVGMSIQPDERTFEYELLAESVAQGLAASFADSGHEPAVRHAPEVTDPAVHVACDAGHIYIDIWDAEHGAGYSLWSGCGEDDQFAHRELASTDALVLARDIAEQIRLASDTGCFTLNC